MLVKSTFFGKCTIDHLLESGYNRKYSLLIYGLTVKQLNILSRTFLKLSHLVRGSIALLSSASFLHKVFEGQLQGRIPLFKLIATYAHIWNIYSTFERKWFFVPYNFINDYTM